MKHEPSATARKLMAEARAKGEQHNAKRQEERVLSDFLNKERRDPSAADQVLQRAAAEERKKFVDVVMEDMQFTMALQTGEGVVRKIQATTDILFTILMRHATSKPQMVTMLREITAAMTMLASEVQKDLELDQEEEDESK